MRASATSSRHITLTLFAVALVLGLLPSLGAQPAAVADEVDGAETAESGEPLAGQLSSEADGAVPGQIEEAGEAPAEAGAEEASDDAAGEVPLIAASQLSREAALHPLSEGDLGTSLLADALAGEPTRFVNQEVPLDGSASVLGSFTVGGMIYAVTGEGAVELAAVAPTVLAGSLAVGSPGAPFGEGSGSGVPPRSVEEQVPSGAASPQPSPEGAPSDGTEGEEASEPVVFEVPESVEHDGITYSVTSIGPRAFVGCDADVVRIPASVASVDEAAFRGSSVGGVEVADGNPTYSSYDGMLFDADQTSLLLVPEGKQGAVRIPKTAEVVPADAFSHCASVTAIEADAGSAAFTSEDGELYDINGNMVLEDQATRAYDRGESSQGTASSLSMRQGQRLTKSYQSCSLTPPPGGHLRWYTKSNYPPSSLPSHEHTGLATFVGKIDEIRSLSGAYTYTLDNNGVWVRTDAAHGEKTYWVGYDSECRRVTTWYRDEACTTIVPAGTRSDKFPKEPLYSKPSAHTVSLVDTPGSGGSGALTLDTGTSIDIVAIPTLAAWEFQGYTDSFATECRLFVASDGKGTARTISEDMTLYANWTRVVSLDANGGAAGSLESLTAGIGRSLGQKCAQVASTDIDHPIRSLFDEGITDNADWAPTRIGYEFAGYYDTADPTGGTCWITKDGIGSTVTAVIPSILHARWTPKGYAVSFDANGGFGGQSSDVTATYGVEMPGISTSKPTRVGYEFMGWYDAADCAAVGTKQYYTDTCESAALWDKVAAATLYAGWRAISYSISYDCAGGNFAEGARYAYTVEDTFDLPVSARYGYRFDGWDVSGVAEDGSMGPVLGAGVEDVTASDGSKATRVKAGTYGDLFCTARWTLCYDLDVPVADPGSVTFEADSVTGQVRVKPGTSAEGELRSYMAVPVALGSLSCEGLGATGQPDPAGGAPELEAIFGTGSAAKVRFIATLGEGASARTAKVTAGGPSATASLSGLSIPAATSHGAPGRIKVAYGLELDSDLAIPPVRDAAPVARLAYTVSLAAAGA